MIDYKRAYELAMAELLESGMAGKVLVAKVEKQVAEMEKENEPCPKCGYIHLTKTSPCGPTLIKPAKTYYTGLEKRDRL